MEGNRRIVLVGDSLLLDAVEASLADGMDLGVLADRFYGQPTCGASAISDS